MVLSIVAAVFSVGPITQGSFGVAVQRTCYHTFDNGYYHELCSQTSVSNIY